MPGLIIGGLGFLLFLFLVPDPGSVGLSAPPSASVDHPRHRQDMDPEGDPLINNEGIKSRHTLLHAHWKLLFPYKKHFN